ncbi:MAG TPA: radical SAM protein [Acidobacteriaceae bacterium]|nr:radical SAM protein [Acidobacteriaceae bacterium]
MTLFYPESATDRDRWITEQRPARAMRNPREPYGFFVEDEYAPNGEALPVATIFLTNRECPFHCAMCDLWRNTLEEPVPAGAIPAQIDFALARLPEARIVKLYNSGSFFDPRAIPVEDYAAIAERVRGFERVIVECHPAFVGERCVEFRDLLAGKLEVAMGLETVHPQILEMLNKRMTLDQFADAADYLRKNGIEVRAFILVQPPFMRPEESLHWAQRSLNFAFDCGATAATLIPTRGGNGAMETLAEAGAFAPPDLSIVEAAAEYGLRQSHGRVFPGRVFVDLWEVKRKAECAACFEARLERLRAMNLQQKVIVPVSCAACGGRVERAV